MLLKSINNANIYEKPWNEGGGIIINNFNDLMRYYNADKNLFLINGLTIRDINVTKIEKINDNVIKIFSIDLPVGYIINLDQYKVEYFNDNEPPRFVFSTKVGGSRTVKIAKVLPVKTSRKHKCEDGVVRKLYKKGMDMYVKMIVYKKVKV